MQVGSLFVTLGIAGGKKAEKDLNKVGQEVQGLSKKAFAAIATLAGVSFGFKMLYDAALRSGVGMSKFSNFTKLSTKELQQWQWAAEKTGVSAEEVEGNVRALQSSIASMASTGAFTPEFYKFANEAGDFDDSRKEDPFYILKKVDDFLRKSQLPVGEQNRILGSLGLSEGMIGDRRNPNRRNPENAPAYAIRSEGRINSLANMSASISSLQKQIQNMFEGVLLKFGPQLIKAFQEAMPVLKELTIAVTRLATYILQLISDPKAKVKEAAETTKEFWDFISDSNKTSMMDRYRDAIGSSVAGALGFVGEQTSDIIINFNQTNNGVSGKDGNAIAAKGIEGMNKKVIPQIQKKPTGGQ